MSSRGPARRLGRAARTYDLLGLLDLEPSSSVGAQSAGCGATRRLPLAGGYPTRRMWRIHRCLGSNLARLELRVSLREWHRRIPEYHLREGVELEFSPVLRQVEYLPLVFG